MKWGCAALAAIAAVVLALEAAWMAHREPRPADATLPAARPTATATATPTPGWWAAAPAWLTPTPTPLTATYRVQRGDTCKGIARRLGIPFRALMHLNPGLDCLNLRPGTLIRVPVTPTPTPTPTPR